MARSVFAALILTCTLAHAERGVVGTRFARRLPWMAMSPACDRYFGNVTGYLHDPVQNLPYDNNFARNADGLVTDEAPFDVDALVRGIAEGSIVHSEVDGRARLIQPISRGILRVPGFRSRIPRRDLQYVRSLERHGFYTTLDQDFGGVLEMCAEMPRFDVDRATGRRKRGRDGKPIALTTLLSPRMKQFYWQMHLHPEGYAHSREIWQTLPGDQRRRVGGLIYFEIAGVVSGETMCVDQTVAKGLGRKLLYDQMADLEQRGHPWLDVQEVIIDRLPHFWRAEQPSRGRYAEMLADRHAEFLKVD